MIDIAIIGGGAAGLSAAVNAAARNKKTLVINGTGLESSSLYKAEQVNNYLGIPAISGRDMLLQFYAHARSAGVEIISGRALQILKMGNCFTIQVERKIIEAKAVILALGISKKGKVKNEAEFTGKGVSYCATCDGMLYRGKDVIVVGEIEEGDSEANFLSEICSSVKYFPLHGTPVNINPSIEIMSGVLTEIVGHETVTAVKTQTGTINCDGVFFIKNAAPAENLIYGLGIESGAVIVDKYMQTNIEGVFACGDCTGAPYQVSSAAGQGLIAGQQAAMYVSKQNVN